MNYLFVGIGGILGALARFYLGTSVQQMSGSFFPYGTLSINLVGCFLLSFIAYGSLFRWKLRRPYILAINTGCIGSFTTFSAFSVELFTLLEKAHYLAAMGYMIFSVICGLAMSWLGIKLARQLYGAKVDTAGGIHE